MLREGVPEIDPPLGGGFDSLPSEPCLPLLYDGRTRRQHGVCERAYLERFSLAMFLRVSQYCRTKNDEFRKKPLLNPMFRKTLLTS